jgi:hypothetical protein
MKKLAYLLIPLLRLAQVDDALAIIPVLPPAPQPDDCDEFLPVLRRLPEEEGASSQVPIFVGPQFSKVDLPLFRSSVPHGPDLTTPITPLPLYLLKSLQI